MNKKKIICVTLLIISIITIVIIYPVRFFYLDQIGDIFTKTIRPIYHVDNNRILYENKVARWQERFSNLKIIEWSDEIKNL